MSRVHDGIEFHIPSDVINAVIRLEALSYSLTLEAHDEDRIFVCVTLSSFVMSIARPLVHHGQPGRGTRRTNQGSSNSISSISGKSSNKSNDTSCKHSLRFGYGTKR